MSEDTERINSSYGITFTCCGKSAVSRMTARTTFESWSILATPKQLIQHTCRGFPYDHLKSCLIEAKHFRLICLTAMRLMMQIATLEFSRDRKLMSVLVSPRRHSADTFCEGSPRGCHRALHSSKLANAKQFCINFGNLTLWEGQASEKIEVEQQGPPFAKRLKME